MPTWPRTIAPARCKIPVFPGALRSRGQSGKKQLRSIENVGRVWEETYTGLRASDPDVRSFLALINEYWRSGTVFDIVHPDLGRLGVGGGTPLVNGATQTGSNIVIDGATASVRAWLRAGDLVKFAGINLAYDNTADVDTDGAGNATIPISPPIFTGGSPADNAAVTITDVPIHAVLGPRAPDLPDSDPTGHALMGLRLYFEEQP